MSKFKIIRIVAKKNWMDSLDRKRYINDIIKDSLECTWQMDYVPEDKHNSLFCSIGEWNSSISDLLYETSYDNLDFNNEAHSKALFRLYSRVLLIISEIITDFQDLTILLKGFSFNRAGLNSARSELTNPTHSFTIQELMDFINNTCKHKVSNRGDVKDSKYHLFNNHIPYVFDDDLESTISANDITINNLLTKVFSTDSRLRMPRLIDMLDTIIYCYGITNSILASTNPTHLRSILDPFEIDLDLLPH